jgi:hypothetical protein
MVAEAMPPLDEAAFWASTKGCAAEATSGMSRPVAAPSAPVWAVAATAVT